MWLRHFAMHDSESIYVSLHCKESEFDNFFYLLWTHDVIQWDVHWCVVYYDTNFICGDICCEISPLTLIKHLQSGMHTYMYAHKCTQTHKRTYTHMQTHTHTDTHTYTHTYTHTHTHTQYTYEVVFGNGYVAAKHVSYTPLSRCVFLRCPTETLQYVSRPKMCKKSYTQIWFSTGYWGKNITLTNARGHP